MEKSAYYQQYVNILKEELRPALGCTEPIAIAFAAAKARDVLDEPVERIELHCSGNIVKNVKGVTVPNSGGLKSLEAAAIIGILAGDADSEFEVLHNVDEEAIALTKVWLKERRCICQLIENCDNLLIRVYVFGANHRAMVEVKTTHTNITHIERDGEVLYSKESTVQKVAATDKSVLELKQIIKFAETCDIADVAPPIERQIELNKAISDEGLAHAYGACVGRVIKETQDWNDTRVRAKACAAAGSDARMSGCPLPVVINSGSGNQGMTVSLPVIEYAETLEVDHETLIRSLVLANLIALLQKRYIGNLSAYCGAVCAAAGAGAGITFLKGGRYDEISAAVTNTLANASGIVCDGAKPSCAAKIALSLDAAFLGIDLAEHHKTFQPGDGLVKDCVEDTIEQIGRMGREGMKQTDVEILKIMLDQ